MADLVELVGGEFVMGTNDPASYRQDGEHPARAATVAPFAISATCVTNEEFATFVAATGYQTDSETYGWSFVFDGLLPEDSPETPAVAGSPWWRQMHGASWRAPEGPGSDVFDRVQDRSDHPAIHVSWNDAVSYCTWADARLPSEAEWEFAARGGLEQATFPWGDELTPNDEHRCNIWQGTFPSHNTLDDGWLGTAPVTSFAPNGYGLYNAVGNVWEWCAEVFTRSPAKSGTCCAALVAPGAEAAPRVMKGGSYLCHDSYCFRYRVAARTSNSPDGAAGNIGFRVVYER